jgi:hypothetical protein
MRYELIGFSTNKATNFQNFLTTAAPLVEAFQNKALTTNARIIFLAISFSPQLVQIFEAFQAEQAGWPRVPCTAGNRVGARHREKGIHITFPPKLLDAGFWGTYFFSNFFHMTFPPKLLDAGFWGING